MRDAFKKIVRVDGVLGLWRGLGPALLLVSHGSIQFTIYDELKRVASKDGQQQLTAVEAFSCGAFSKICAQVLSPLHALCVRYRTQFILVTLCCM